MEKAEIDLIGSIASGLGLQTQAGREFLALALENVRLFDRKQQDYGPGNIQRHGVYGVVVRMCDKVERLKNLELSDLSKEERDKVKRVLQVLKHLRKHEHRLSILDVINKLDEEMQNIERLFPQKRRKAKNEGVLDSFRDISNYAIIATMLETGKWPEVEK